MPKPNFARECALAAITLFEEDGISDPSHTEIALKALGRKTLPPGTAEGVRKNLRRIQEMLRNMGYLVHCCGPGNYDKHPPERPRGQTFRKLAPQDETEAHYASPIGRGKPRWGIRFAFGRNDHFWQYMNTFHRNSAAPSTKWGLQRWVRGKKAGHVSLRPARQEAKKTIDGILPDNIAELGQLGNGETNGEQN
jgi:hypothetical protein